MLARENPRYNTTNRSVYQEYKSTPAIWETCPLRDACTQSCNHTKVVTGHVLQHSLEKIPANRLSPWGKRIYERYRGTIEHPLQKDTVS